MRAIALFKKFLSKPFIASVEVSSMARCSSKIDELRDIYSIGCTNTIMYGVILKGLLFPMF